MYLVQSNVIRGLTKQQYRMLGEMCIYANNLYNVALYNIRQYYFENKKYLRYEENYHQCKLNENYKLLQAGVSQQILKVADKSFKSFFSLIKKAKDGEYNYKDIRLPHYQKKGGMYNLILSTNSISINDGYFTIPVSREFHRQHNDSEIKIRFPERLIGKRIKEVRILPMNNGKYFKIQYVYEQSVAQADVDVNKKMGIDIGVDNLASCITTIGTSFIMDGRKLTSINQGWNKAKARLQSITDKQGRKQTDKIFRITEKRNNQVKDILRKTARYIINYCIDNHIGTVVAGYNTDFKRNVNMGRVNNQSFVNVSLSDLRRQLNCLCERYGIKYVEQEESYTSKASFLDDDFIPVYKEGESYNGKFSGRRIYRGLYKSKDKTLINADLNGAANILRKSKQNFDKEELNSGLLASPLRIRVA